MQLLKRRFTGIIFMLSRLPTKRRKVMDWRGISEKLHEDRAWENLEWDLGSFVKY